MKEHLLLCIFFLNVHTFSYAMDWSLESAWKHYKRFIPKEKQNTIAGIEQLIHETKARIQYPDELEPFDCPTRCLSHKCKAECLTDMVVIHLAIQSLHVAVAANDSQRIKDCLKESKSAFLCEFADPVGNTLLHSAIDKRHDGIAWDLLEHPKLKALKDRVNNVGKKPNLAVLPPIFLLIVDFLK